MTAPRVLVVLGTEAAWSRGVLRGFMAAAHEEDWTLLHYWPGANLKWLANEWSPAAVVFGPELDPETVARFAPAALVSVPIDRSAKGIASVCPDEKGIGTLAALHFVERGFRFASTFRYDDATFAVARERAFIDGIRAAGGEIRAGWGNEDFTQSERQERPAAMIAWLRSLPRPCGIFTCTDGWGHTVARYAREAGLRIPEDIALVGADNDVLGCELLSPPLSSVVIPWKEVGRNAAMLVRSALEKQPTTKKRIVVSPVGVIGRRSSDVLAVDDALVAEAMTWIREHADRRLTVPMVARALGGGRQRLERRFRRTLDRTIQEEIRRAHVERARHILATTRSGMTEVAKRSGFSSASLLHVAFRRELGMAPGSYRRRVQGELRDSDDD
jgi:LacI family transcriptional regulator